MARGVDPALLGRVHDVPQRRETLQVARAFVDAVDVAGYAIVEGVLAPGVVTQLATALKRAAESASVRTRGGRIAEDAIARVRSTSNETTCAVGSGGALLMRPLLLHASSPASSPLHRRVIHFDFASATLPDGLQWSTSERPRVPTS